MAAQEKTQMISDKNESELPKTYSNQKFDQKIPAHFRLRKVDLFPSLNMKEGSKHKRDLKF
jgi:hypothetical protein